MSFPQRVRPGIQGLAKLKVFSGWKLHHFLVWIAGFAILGGDA
jgi:hypothetical protein